MIYIYTYIYIYTHTHIYAGLRHLKVLFYNRKYSINVLNLIHKSSYTYYQVA